MDVSKIVSHYIKLRDDMAAMRQRHKDELAPLRDDMDSIENALHKVMHEQGVESLKTRAGTPYIQEVTNIKVTDWEATLEAIKEREAWGLLYRNVAKTAYLESGAELPGLETSTMQKVNVRRS